MSSDPENKNTDVIKLQKIFIKVGKSSEKLQMNINYHDKQLLILMFYKENYQLEKEKVMEINAAINKNNNKISNLLDENIKLSLQSDDAYKFMYFNGMNMASKYTNGLIKESFLLSNALIIRKTFEFL
jgi:hypothetical protein